MNSVRSKIIQLIHDIRPVGQPDLSQPGAPLVDGDFDSLDFASLLMAVEDEFGITIDEESVHKVGTLDGLTEFTENLIRA